MLLIRYDPKLLSRVRDLLRAGNPTLRPAADQLYALAEADLSAPLRSVMEKSRIPPSGDKHDYLSLGSYWWPDPESSDGLPYIRRDGQWNPEGAAYDHHALQETWGRVWRLALAAWLLDETRFAKHAMVLVRRWFVDPDTRMNPHLEYAQHIPGRCEGRGIGIIDTELIPEVLDATVLLADLGAWPDAVAQPFDQWCRDYLDWLLTSTHGRDERRWHNNHANYYDLQVAALARATGQDGIALLTLENVAHRRIATQVEPDGRLPDELGRTLSQHYVLFNLSAFVTLAELGRPIDVDLWSFETHDGRSLEKAIRWFVDHDGLTPEWAGQQIEPFDYSGCVWLLRQAGTRIDPAFHAMTADLPGIDPTGHLANLLYPAPQPQRQPLP